MQNCVEHPFPNNCIPALSTAERKDQLKMYVFIYFFFILCYKALFGNVIRKAVSKG